jgi:arylsulfatase A-like enzyme
VAPHRGDGLRRDSWRSAPALLALALSGFACGERAESPPRPTRGYVVISIDTLRADHLGCYGYPRPTSPFLDSLASRGTLFEEAYAQFPSTLISHMSLFTGLLPREHDVGHSEAVLSPEIETFPEVFSRAGFRAGGFTEGGYVSGRYGFRRGFEVFEGSHRGSARKAAATFRRGAEFLAGLRPQDRFLLFLHTYQVHTPYNAATPYPEMFWPGAPPADALHPTGPALVDHNLEVGPLSADALAHLTALYDAGIRETDEALRGFFAELDRLGLGADTTVIVTSDHGEELQDHSRFLHTQLYREVLRVPLLVIHPDQREPVRQPRVVQLVDVAPTLYELAGLRPAKAPTGRSFAPLVGRAAPPGDSTAWADGEDGDRAVYRRRGGALESLLFASPRADLAGRRLLFDAPAGEVEFEVRAHREPRRLRVESDGRELAAVDLGADWQRLSVTLPPGGGRLLLSVDGCARPADARRRDAPTCWGFELRGIHPHRVEFYDLDADPTQRQDLSRHRSDASRALVRELLAFRPRPRAGAAAAPLDAELEESLRALGYLQ